MYYMVDYAVRQGRTFPGVPVMEYKTETGEGNLQETCSPSWNEVPKSDSAKAWTSLRQMFGEKTGKAT